MRRLFRFPSRTRRDIESDVDAELGFHLEARAEALIAAGLTAEQARGQALREFGDLNQARRTLTALDRRTEASRRRADYFDDLRQDIGYAFRRLRGAPGFAFTAILTLALGIGANTAIFSVVNSVLFRPLPFPEPEQLYRVWSASSSAGTTQASVSPPDLDDWRAQRRQIADLGAYWYAAGGSGIDLTGQGDPQRLAAVYAEAGFFSTLRVAAAIGRVPRNDELVRGGRDRVVVLAHHFWQRQFAGNPAVIGSTITLSGEPHEILGVMPPEFRFPAADVEVFVPYSTIPDDAIPRIRQVRILAAFARAAPGVSIDGVRAEMATITAHMAVQYPENAAWDGATVMPLRDSITGSVRTALLVLLGAVMFVLLIACVNVAALQLARAFTRSREIALRTALGAGRGRIVRQLLTESLVLALLGGVAGLLVARLTLAVIVALGADQLPRGVDVSLDGPMLGAALALSLLTGLLFGLAPALRATAVALQESLRAGGRGMTGGDGTRLRNGLVIGEVALAVVLVIGGGLMLRSFKALLDVDPGFRPDHLLVLNFTLSTDRHPDYREVYQQILEEARRLPGVLAAGVVKDAPLRGSGERTGFTLPGMVVPAGEEPPSVAALNVSDGYFNAIGATIVAGREFTTDDRQDGLPVVVVNEAFARKWFPGERVVGKHLIRDGQWEVVGLVRDIRQVAMAEPAAPTVYFRNQQMGRVRMNLILRTQGEPLTLARSVRAMILSMDPLQPITEIFTMDDAVSDALARPRLLTVLIGAFGGLGLLLVAIGLYGVLAYMVNQRQKEIGVRLAVGAEPGEVLRMIIRRGLRLTVAGVIIGLLGAFVVGRFLRGVLYGVGPSDPATFVLVTLLLLAVAVLASWVPARRAAMVDPAVTLRAD